MPLCQVCGKGVTYGNNVSHSKRRTSRRWLPNVQKATIAVDGVPVSVRICTRCMRTLEKTK